MKVTALTQQDAPTFQALRLRALREHPEAFGQSFELEKNVPVETVAALLETSPDAYHLGAFEGDLLGVLSFFRRQGPKLNHKAMIGGMYVVPKARRRGVGKALLRGALHRAESLPGLEELVLAVTVGNEGAKRLYLSAGFKPYCLETGFIRVDARYFDIEWMSLHL